jgi:hypothetical protein
MRSFQPDFPCSCGIGLGVYCYFHQSNFMRKHKLKTWPVYFEEIASGRLSFSIRENEGRGFQKGDIAVLEEWNPDTVGTSKYTGRSMELEITYVESSWGLSPGKVALGFSSDQRVVFTKEQS